MNTGLIIRPIEKDHYVHGDNKLGTVPLQPDGQWDAFVPMSDEQQNSTGLEPMDCTTNALRNVIFTIEKQIFGGSSILSERFLAYISGTTKQGNDPHTVAETLRKQGDADEIDWPRTSTLLTWEEFYAKPTQDVYIKAKEFVAQYAFGHSWVTDTSPTGFMQALTYSPLTAGVYAWIQDSTTGYYINPNNFPPEHDIVIYGYVEGQYWKVFDSYQNDIKKLAWDFPFSAVKRYTLDRQIVNPTAWQNFLNWMNDIIAGIQNAAQKTLGLGDYAYERTLGAARSPEWPKVRNAYIKTHPTCELCGERKSLNVHHIKDFSTYPELELEPLNFIALCEPHHLLAGHLMNFRSINPNVREDAAHFLAEIRNRR